MRALRLFSLLVIICRPGILIKAQTARPQYPESRRESVIDNYHGITVKDPYRWLEQDTAEETKKWIVAQNQLTESYLSQIPFRQSMKERISELMNYPRWSLPVVCGSYLFFQSNTGLQDQPVLSRQEGFNGPESEFINPIKISAKGTTSVSIAAFSKDKK